MGQTRSSGVSTRPSALSWADVLPRDEIAEFGAERFSASLRGGCCTFSWGMGVTDKVNPVDEDLHLVIRDSETERNVVEERVTHLQERTVTLSAGGEFEAMLVRKERFSFSCGSTLPRLPRILFVKEEEGRYQLTWSEIPWERIRREVELLHGVNWDLDIDVALRVQRWYAEGVLPEEEMLYPGFTDTQCILGQPRQIDMDVLARDTGERLMRIFSVQLHAPKNLEIVEKLAFKTPQSPPRLHLRRQVVEPDTCQLLARWDVDHEDWAEVEEKILAPLHLRWSDVEVRLRLFDVTEDRLELDPDAVRVVTTCDAFTFSDVSPGRTYQAELWLSSRESHATVGKEALLESPPLSLPARTASMTLLPLNETRLLAYWSLDDEVLASLAAESDASGRLLLAVSRDEDGEPFPEPDLDVELEWGGSDSLELTVRPDHVYTARLFALDEGGKKTALTPASNRAQTPRRGPGTNPVSHRSLNALIEHPSVRSLDHPGDVTNHGLGQLILHLHGHVPFLPPVAAGESGDLGARVSLQERVYEEILTSHAPLCDMLRQLGGEGIDFRLSCLVSPTFAAFLRHPEHQEGLLRHVERRVAQARVEFERAERSEPQVAEVIGMQLDRWERTRDLLLHSGLDLTRPLRELQDQGRLEIVTCPATHALLPHLTYREAMVRAQIEIAIRDHERVFGRGPNGFWLPSCGYTPGLEKLLQAAGLHYCFAHVDALSGADAPLAQNAHTPVFAKGSDLVLFPVSTTGEEFDGRGGFPSHPDYLELERFGRMLRTYRATGAATSHREIYDPAAADERLNEDVGGFLDRVESELEQRFEGGWTRPVTVAVASIATLGHRWFEGIEFLERVLRRLHHDQSAIELSTPSDHLQSHHTLQEIYPDVSSSGSELFEPFSSGAVRWMPRHLQQAADEMVRMAGEAHRHDDRSPLENRILAQSGRELLLAQALDHPRALSSGIYSRTMKELFLQALGNFWTLTSMYWGLSEGRSADEATLRSLESRDRILPHIDPALFLAPPS